ncbi:MAG: Uma2 family endonuclease [Acidobacteriota bacterium]
MSTQTLTYYEIVSQLPYDTVVTFHNVTWEEYEELLEQVGEPAGLRISYDDGTLKAMTLSNEHEKYARFIEKLVATITIRLRINILSFGSATMKRKPKGNEPDACFYVQSADAIGNRVDIDLAVDPPPDIAVEVDIHHDSQDKFSIYAAFGVPEIWRFDGQEVTIYLLDQDRYHQAEAGRALPLLTGEILTQFLARMRDEGEFCALLAFDEWLQSQRS